MLNESIFAVKQPPLSVAWRVCRRLAFVIPVALLASATVLDEASAPTGDFPRHLHDTGLYVRGSTGLIAPDVLSFTPQYPLWSDGAAKRRWLRLPPGTQIDARDPDAWEFPPGTKLWKQFSFERAIETRYIERRADGSWHFATYVWNEDGTDAVLAPARGVRALPVKGAPNGRYDLPAQADCGACHEGAAAPVLGFGALQLSPDRDPNAAHGVARNVDDIDLAALVERGLIRHLPPALLAQPPRIAAATPVERAALGYLHGNCGHCHNDNGSPAPVNLSLAQTVMDGDASHRRVLRTLIDAPGRFRPAGAQVVAPIIKPGFADASVLPLRMRSRHANVQMPPLGTNAVDSEGLALIERWIFQLNPKKE